MGFPFYLLTFLSFVGYSEQMPSRMGLYIKQENKERKIMAIDFKVKDVMHNISQEIRDKREAISVIFHFSLFS